MATDDDAAHRVILDAAEPYLRRTLDLGTGDGRFAYRCAQADPDQFVLGVDAHADSMREITQKAAKKPAKGGLPNARFLTAALPELPEAFDAFADVVTIVMPWGSLLAGLIVPERSVLDAVRRVLRPGGVVHVILNGEVWHDAGSIEHHTLPAPTIEHIDSVLVPAYAEAGLVIDDRHPLDRDEIKRVRSSWMRRLASGRANPRFVYLRARVR